MIVCLFYFCVLLEEFFVWLEWLMITMFMLLRHLLLLLVFSTADSNSALLKVLLLSINSLDRKIC